MTLKTRTLRDRDFSEILKKYGSLSNADLSKLAAQYPRFSKMTPGAIEKDVDRFVQHYENLGIIRRASGRVKWLPAEVNAPMQSKSETKAEPTTPPPESKYKTVQKLVQGLANGSIVLKDKSPHKELNRIKGEIYDKFMADIDLYNTFKDSFGLSDVLVTRIYNTAPKLRAYGFIEEKE